MYVYATNSLSWTCVINDVNVANKAGGHVADSPLLVLADKGKFVRLLCEKALLF